MAMTRKPSAMTPLLFEKKALSIHEFEERFNVRYLRGYLPKEVRPFLHLPLPALNLCKINESKGYGIKALTPIPEGAFLGVYLGEVLEDDILTRGESDYRFHYEGKLIIDGARAGNFTRFYNHSFTPNMDHRFEKDGPIRYMTFWANRQIQANEELCYHYGNHYWLIRGSPE